MQPTLLLADDSITIQRVVELTFADEHVRVIAVADGEQAIQRIDAEPPDIVLADVGMPKVDGYGVAAHVKRSPALARIPVLLLTGAFDPVDDGKAKACGCDGVLVKPFEPQVLIARVKELIASRRQLASPPAAAPVPVARPTAPPPAAEPAAQPAAMRQTPVPGALRQSPVPRPPRHTPPPVDPAPPLETPLSPSMRAPHLPGPTRSTPVPHVPLSMRETPIAGSLRATPIPGSLRSTPPPNVSRDPDLAAVLRKGDDIFEMELDELDQAFSKLDPTVPPADLDVHVVSEFARDLHEMRSTPIPMPAGAPPMSWDDQDREAREALADHALPGLEVDVDPMPEHPRFAPEPSAGSHAEAVSVEPHEPLVEESPYRWEHQQLPPQTPLESRDLGAAELGDSELAPSDFTGEFGDWDLPARPAQPAADEPMEVLESGFMPPKIEHDPRTPVEFRAITPLPVPAEQASTPMVTPLPAPRSTVPPSVVSTPLSPAPIAGAPPAPQPGFGNAKPAFEIPSRVPVRVAEPLTTPPPAPRVNSLGSRSVTPLDASVRPEAQAPDVRAPEPARANDALTGKVSIATAFSALLAAEQRQPALRPVTSTPALSDAVLDEVVRRVVARMSADAVQQVVVTTAERLVREEIERIKGTGE